MKLLIITACVALLTGQSQAQKSSRDLKEAHRAALARYLNGHKTCDFLPESAFDDNFGKGELDLIKKSMKDHFQKPYYLSADLNHDGYGDFAMLLARGKGLYRIVVWNGVKKSGYRVAWEDDIDYNRMFSLSWESAKKRRLAFGLPESDMGFCLTPAGGSYVPEGN